MRAWRGAADPRVERARGRSWIRSAHRDVRVRPADEYPHSRTGRRGDAEKIGINYLLPPASERRNIVQT
jgi:hypothetical protein